MLSYSQKVAVYQHLKPNNMQNQLINVEISNIAATAINKCLTSIHFLFTLLSSFFLGERLVAFKNKIGREKGIYCLFALLFFCYDK